MNLFSGRAAFLGLKQLHVFQLYKFPQALNSVTSDPISNNGMQIWLRTAMIVLVEADKRKKWYDLPQQLLAHLQDAPEERPQTQGRLNLVEWLLVDETWRVMNVADIYENG